MRWALAATSAAVVLCTSPAFARNEFQDIPAGEGKHTIVVDAVPNPQTVYLENYALVITSSAYNPWPPLRTTAAGEDVAKALRMQGFGVARLKDPDGVTLRRTVSTFIASHGSSEARLVIYYAGHGWRDRADNGYLIGVDAPFTDKGATAVANKSLSTQQIVEYARSSHARHTLFIFDACYSGALVHFSSIAFTSRSPVVSSRRLIDLMHSGSQFISSATDDETTPDQSRFTPALIKGISGDADINQDGLVLGSELAGYLKDVITNPLQPVGGKPTTPQYGDLLANGGDILFSYRRGVVPKFRPPVARRAPTPTALSGIKVLYFKKSADGGGILRMLDRLPVTYEALPSVHSGLIPSDGIACSADTPAAAIISLAHAMAASGFKIRGISPIRKRTDTRPFMEIASYSSDHIDYYHAPFLNMKVVDALKACPSEFLSGEQYPEQ